MDQAKHVSVAEMDWPRQHGWKSLWRHGGVYMLNGKSIEL